jgi:hypothetical protein
MKSWQKRLIINLELNKTLQREAMKNPEVTVEELRNFIDTIFKFWTPEIEIIKFGPFDLNSKEGIRAFAEAVIDRFVLSQTSGKNAVFKSMCRVIKVLDGADKWETLGMLMFPKSHVEKVERQIQEPVKP